MKRYQKFMDGVRASDTLHRRLVELKEPEKKPAAWMKYGTVAAALALVVGTGAWGLKAGLPWAGYDKRLVDLAPENATAGVPDIAPVESIEPAPHMFAGGYDVTEDGVTAHYLLPYIEYGGTQDTQTALDWDVPPGSVKRDLTGEEIAALMGGEDAVSTHLGWGVEYVLTGWAAWYEDGSFWGAYINGIMPNYGAAPRELEFAVTAGQLPPTCIVYPGSVEQNISGVMVTADKSDWEEPWGSSSYDVHERRVSFLKGDYGFRFEFSSGDPELTEEMVSRLVRWVVDSGVAADRLSSDGAALAHPWEADPNTGVGEPNWNDSGEGRTCPDCGVYIEPGMKHYHTQDGGVDTSYYDPNGYALNAYDPNELADRGINPGEAVPESDSFLTCRTCGGGVPDGTGHYCKADGSGGYVCALCGEAFPEGKVHSHEICGYPLAPETYTCETCGESVPYGMAHDCAMCDGYPVPYVCEVCGQTLPAGVEHSHSCEVCGETLLEGVEHSHQEEHHQDHHGDHH